MIAGYIFFAFAGHSSTRLQSTHSSIRIHFHLYLYCIVLIGLQSLTCSTMASSQT
jgi:hypothetical protein